MDVVEKLNKGYVCRTRAAAAFSRLQIGQEALNGRWLSLKSMLALGPSRGQELDSLVQVKPTGSACT